MRLSYHEETDSLYIHLVERPGVDADEVAPGIIVDYDTDGKPVGIDIDHAKNVIDLTTLETGSLPLKVKSA
ncbi:MAG: DUF2283 domain-containing protein [Candidatus Scalindua rubra]|uniref:DUF2283 domain-containing protein n=1 Tax=Candidatus Scalindua brodae TaxID=237368 RepID=A0A0B0ELQ0_9BACT|nr:MAG: hypothetical protein SCABRO_02675 [Candidatus Scalindua brodae]MBZ0108459.1 DUF2283 domain-containing protein [Candidatus Scalindua rubra]TWU30919.1 hypothetical protein S225a_23620 [Candidatus Brocadiaceae bacterium S225]